jgi:hypothetical protein
VAYAHRAVQGQWNQVLLFSRTQRSKELIFSSLCVYRIQPHYGRALAKYILSEHHQALSLDPSLKLIVYEMGAGNGTLMRNILDYVQEMDPKAYSSAQYTVIEISSQLAERQEEHNFARLRSQMDRHAGIKIVNRSIFDWDVVVPEQCFFIALEVIVSLRNTVVFGCCPFCEMHVC